MQPLLGGVIGAVLGGLINGLGGAVAGALLGYLLLQVLQQEKQLRAQGERLKAIHVLIEESRYGERIRLLQQRLTRLEGHQAAQSSTGADSQTVLSESPRDLAADPGEISIAPAAPVAQSAFESQPSEIMAVESCSDTHLSTKDANSPAWLANILSGNPLAKVGAVLLFLGIASGFKLAVEHGWFPLPLRVLLTASMAVTMIVFGWQQRIERTRFADALQGSGFAILYLIVFFMLSRWGWITPTVAFAAFVILSSACTGMALLQSTQVLAIFGMAGGFLAPILASSEQNSHILLFSFYLLLGVALMVASAWRGWRALPITGMLLTFAVGLSWAWENYMPTNYASTQAFLLAFFFLYGLWPLVVTRRFPLIAMDAPLAFGVPLCALALQYSLVEVWRYGFSVSALVLGVFYLFLWAVSGKRKDWLPAAFLGIGIASLTVAIPFAFDVAPSAGLWAVEGAAGLAVALRCRARLGMLASVGLQGVAGLYLLTELGQMSATLPVMNAACLSAALVALAGMSSASLLARSHAASGREQHLLVRIILAWALLWWFATGWREIDLFIIENDARLMALLLHWAGTILLLECCGGLLHWTAVRRVASWLNLILVPVLGYAWIRWGHVFFHPTGWAWGAALMSAWWVRWCQDTKFVDKPALVHSLLFGLTLVALVFEAVWRAQAGLQASHYGHYAFGLPVITLGLIFCMYWPYWPVRTWQQTYTDWIAQPVVFVLLLGSTVLSLLMDGQIGSIAYQPLFSVFDGFQFAAFYMVYVWSRPEHRRLFRRLLWGAGFIWLSLLPVRIATAWFGERFVLSALVNVPEAATGLALVWTALALMLMWLAQRYQNRIRWFAGFILLCAVGGKLLFMDLRSIGTLAWTISLIGVSLLVLAASYIAPAPPKEDNRQGQENEPQV